MKELFYKDIVGNNPRKHEVSIEEISDRTKMRIAKKWICKYFIKEKYQSNDEDKVKEWIQRERQQGCKKNYHILRQYDAKTGENRIVCKILGDFFVVLRDTVYKIVYVNEIRVYIAGAFN